MWGSSPGVALVELPQHQHINHLNMLLAIVMRAGPRILLAHPERYPFMMADPSSLDDLIEDGLLFQVTASAFRPASRSVRLAEALLHRGSVHILASDAHNAQAVGTMIEGLERLREIAGESTVRLLTEENPAALLNGSASIAAARPPIAARRRWFAFGKTARS
jgi:protein-tyrosine phosphatase